MCPLYIPIDGLIWILCSSAECRQCFEDAAIASAKLVISKGIKAKVQLGRNERFKFFAAGQIGLATGTRTHY
jgi:hypothetical protein